MIIHGAIFVIFREEHPSNELPPTQLPSPDMPEWSLDPGAGGSPWRLSPTVPRLNEWNQKMGRILRRRI
jgi:hypothetical protein